MDREIMYFVLLLSSMVLQNKDFTAEALTMPCEKGTFGPGCHYTCHCVTDDQCDTFSGHCASCAVGWFGPACQYENMAVYDTRGSPKLIDTFGTHTIHYQWSAQIYYSWIRLQFNDVNEVITNFTVSVKLTGEWLRCRDEVIQVVDCVYVDVHCKDLMPLKEMQLTFNDGSARPKVFISGGIEFSGHYANQWTTIVKDNSDAPLMKHTDILSLDGSLVNNPVELTCAYKFPTLSKVNRIAIPYQTFVQSVTIRYSSNCLEMHTELFEPWFSILPQELNDITIIYISTVNGTACNARLYGEPICHPGSYGINCQSYCFCGDSHCFTDSGVCERTGDNAIGLCKKVCPQGFYGPSCDQACPSKCEDGQCHQTTGNCFQCAKGFSGAKCLDQCPPTYHGVMCAQKCSDQCLNQICYAESGSCVQCAAGWSGDMCDDVCTSGWYGVDCANTCPKNCLKSCDPVTGQCVTCDPGFHGLQCEEECSKGYFGKNCSRLCPVHCMDSHCHPVNGVCLVCQSSYTGIFCNKECANGTYGPYCLLQCSKNCKTPCSSDGTCQCLAGFTGETCRKECDQHFYGENCTKKCSENCLDAQCQPTDGKCLNCQPGKTGDYCGKVCPRGFYGYNCTKQCPVACAGTLCSPVMGKCLLCQPGFNGDNCDKECKNGTYGILCKFQCSSNCKDSLCSPSQGFCYECNLGYFGRFCGKVCNATLYGANCSHNCSGQCTDRLCNHVTGRCLTCIPGYTGEFCDEECEVPYYGQNCKSLCEAKCTAYGMSRSRCHHVTGQCLNEPDTDKTDMWAGIACTVIMVCLIITVLVVLRRRGVTWSQVRRLLRRVREDQVVIVETGDTSAPL